MASLDSLSVTGMAGLKSKDTPLFVFYQYQYVVPVTPQLDIFQSPPTYFEVPLHNNPPNRDPIFERNCKQCRENHL